MVQHFCELIDLPESKKEQYLKKSISNKNTTAIDQWIEMDTCTNCSPREFNRYVQIFFALSNINESKKLIAGCTILSIESKDSEIKMKRKWIIIGILFEKLVTRAFLKVDDQ